MDRFATRVEHRQLDPRVVRSEARGPDHDCGVQRRAALRAHAAYELDAVLPRELPVARADQQIAAALRPPEAADRSRYHSEVVAPPVEALTEDAARHPRWLRSNGEADPPGPCELLRDLDAGVATADDQRIPLRQLIGISVLRAVQLNDRRVELLRHLGGVRALIRTRCHDNLRCLVTRAVDGLDAVPPFAVRQSRHLRLHPHWQLERPRVRGEVVGHLVLAWKPLGIAREGKPRKRAVSADGEELERVPALSPRMTDPVAAVEDSERDPCLFEVITRRHSGLAAPDHQCLWSRHPLGLASCESLDDSESRSLELFHHEPLVMYVLDRLAQQVVGLETDHEPVERALAGADDGHRTADMLGQDEPTARLEHSARFANRLAGVGDRAEAVRAQDRFERRVREVELLRVAEPEVGVATEIGCAVLREIEHRGAELDPGEPDVVGVVRKVQARADGELENVASCALARPDARVPQDEAFEEAHAAVVLRSLLLVHRADPILLAAHVGYPHARILTGIGY